jgi:hypothetical protein
MLRSALSGFVLGTVLFALRITFLPGMQGITFRPDDTGKLCFTPKNLLRVMAAPFHDKNFWKRKLLDVNYILYVGGATGIVYLCAEK